MRGVVLAAGEGSRMWPLAEDRPKHLLPVAGKPLLGQILSALAENSVTDVLVVTGFQGGMIREALGDGADFGVRLRYLNQPKRTGTASALKVASEEVGREQFLAMYGDLMVNAQAIRAVVEGAKRHSNVIGVTRIDDPSEYGLVDVSDGKVVGISEKPGKRKEGWVNTGIYALDDDTFNAIEKTRPSKRGEYELTSSLQFLINRGIDVGAAIINSNNWLDVGRPWDLLTANERALMMLQPKLNGSAENGAVMSGPVCLEKGASVRAGSHIEGPVYIGRGSIIGPNARIRAYTMIDDDVLVGPACDIKNSVILRGTKIPHLSYVGDSIIGQDCNLGAGTITANLRFDEQTVKMKIKGRMFDTKRKKLGSILGDRVKTGITVSLMPGVRVGPAAMIGAGAVISDDVAAGEKVTVKQQLVRRSNRKLGKKLRRR